MTHFKRARPGTDSGTAPGSVPGPDQCLFTLSGPDTALTRPSTLPPFVFNGDVPTSQCKLRHFRASTRLSALIYKWAEHGDLFTLQIDRAEPRRSGPRNFFLRLFRAAAVFNFLQVPDLAGLGYGLGLGFWVVFTITVSLTLTLTLITTLTIILH